MAWASVSLPWLIACRPRSVASAALSRPSRAFSPRNSRVSRPDAGAYNRASAAPLTAPSKNASRTLPAPAPSSRAMSAPDSRLEDAHLHVEVLLRVFGDLRDQRRKLIGDLVH